jgi:mitochondrial fission protein ELM1
MGEGKGGGVGILLGGDNDQYQMDADWVDRLLDEVLKGTNKKILVTTSRRTSTEAEAVVQKKLKENPQCDLLEIASRSNQNGVVEKILQNSELILVTGESMSMVSEAVSSSKPVVVVFPPAKRRGVTKHLRMVQDLEKQGFVKVAELDKVSEALSAPVTESEVTQKLLNEERERLLAGLRGL